MPQCGSVRFIVPVHVPSTILGRYIAFCSLVPWLMMAAMAPCVRPGYMAKAMLADEKYSATAECSA